jgi:hypothetical protein
MNLLGIWRAPFIVKINRYYGGCNNENKNPDGWLAQA